MQHKESILEFELTATQTLNALELPKGSKPLSVGVRNGKVVVWMRGEAERQTNEHRFLFLEIGSEYPGDLWQFAGTVQIGPFVWHVFHREQPE